MKINFREIVKLGLILFAICFIAAAMLAMVKDVTDPLIFTQREAASEASRKEVFPDADAFEAISGEELAKLQGENGTINEVYLALKGSDTVGYVVKASPKGFGGPVAVITGISADNAITGVRVGDNQETPGLGTLAQDEKFYGQYSGMNASGNIGVNKVQANDTEIQAITGATITSRAVTDGVNAAIGAIAALTQ